MKTLYRPSLDLQVDDPPREGGPSAAGGAMHCGRCGRVLTAPESRALGYGPVCAAKLGIRSGAGRNGSEAGPEHADLRLFDNLFEVGLVCRRAKDGTPVTNVPHLVTHHSPDGFEFGYGGSGPGDLALNLVEAFLRRTGWNGRRSKVYRGECFELSLALHQEAKWDLIATLDQEQGGHVPAERIWDWLDRAATADPELPVLWNRGMAP